MKLSMPHRLTLRQPVAVLAPPGRCAVEGAQVRGEPPCFPAGILGTPVRLQRTCRACHAWTAPVDLVGFVSRPRAHLRRIDPRLLKTIADTGAGGDRVTVNIQPGAAAV